MRALFLVTLLFITCAGVNADILRTSRSANIKEEPSSSSGTLEHVDEGVELDLLDDGAQQNGYYRVQTANGNIGWIYRTLVRRFGTNSIESSSAESSEAAGGSLRSGASDVEVTVIDVGAGLSCLIKLPGNKHIIYDGGKSAAFRYLEKVLPENGDIELMILSHTDADHWGAVEDIVTNFHVKSIVRTSYRKNDYSQTYVAAVSAIESADGLEDINLAVEGNLPPGKVLYNKDGVKLIAVCGFKEPLPAWGRLDNSKANNAVSIVVRLEYKNHSILFGGDAVGLDDCSAGDECIATEKFMLENSAALLNSDVIIAPHHGADNASCPMFIEKVSPEFVVFSAGHAHRHPRQITAERYLLAGVDEANIFRTDRGDHEIPTSDDECKFEWSLDDSGSTDKLLDDNVRIILPNRGKVKVAYVN